MTTTNNSNNSAKLITTYFFANLDDVLMQSAYLDCIQYDMNDRQQSYAARCEISEQMAAGRVVVSVPVSE